MQVAATSVQMALWLMVEQKISTVLGRLSSHDNGDTASRLRAGAMRLCSVR